jgi:hypothetical protein
MQNDACAIEELFRREMAARRVRLAEWIRRIEKECGPLDGVAASHPIPPRARTCHHRGAGLSRQRASARTSGL